MAPMKMSQTEDVKETESVKAEAIRKKYYYRRLILTGEIVLSYKRASPLVGPDCAYHLYSKEIKQIKEHRE